MGLSKESYEVAEVYSRNSQSIDFLSNRIGVSYKNNLTETVKNSDVIFITVPDSCIQNTAHEIAEKMNSQDIAERVFFHCSGALTSDVLLPIANKGGITASFHPIQTFADIDNGWKGLYNIYFGFEGNCCALKYAKEISDAFDANILSIKKENKPLYHAAACIMSNYMAALFHIAEKLLGDAGIDSNEGVKAFKPLIDKTIENIYIHGSQNALTGPISRGDYNVVANHVNAIKDNPSYVSDVYKSLGKAAVDIALTRESIDRETAEIIYRLLT